MKFNTKDNKIFFTSDLHFGHSNIIKFCKRPFTFEEQNDKLVELWNNVVSENDIVFVLGDTFWKSNKESISAFKKLKGQIYLIKGNHDGTKVLKSIENYVKGIYDSLYVDINDQRCYLSHYKITDIPKNIINIHGHLHSKPNKVVGRKTYDCGVDGNDYKPVSFETIYEKVKNYKEPLWKKIIRKLRKMR